VQIENGQKVSTFKKSSGLKIEANILFLGGYTYYTIEVKRLFKKKSFFFWFTVLDVPSFILFKLYSKKMKEDIKCPLSVPPISECYPVLSKGNVEILDLTVQYTSPTGVRVQGA
jgi:hypothetical protein